MIYQQIVGVVPRFMQERARSAPQIMRAGLGQWFAFLLRRKVSVSTWLRSGLLIGRSKSYRDKRTHSDPPAKIFSDDDISACRDRDTKA